MVSVGFWNELDRSYGIFSCDAIKDMMIRSFARLGNTDKIIVKATEESIEIKEREAFECMMKSKRVKIETYNGSKFITMLKYFETQVYHLLPYFLIAAPISNSPLIYQLFYCLEPNSYEPAKKIQLLKQLYLTYDCKSAFYYDIGRDKWRFCNNFRRTKVSLGHYGLNGGEGKGIMSKLRHLI
jgi:hypothetical protein